MTHADESDTSEKPAAEPTPFERDERNFAQMARSVVFAEPTRFFTLGYFMVLLSVAVLLTWSTLSYTNISHYTQGEVFSGELGVAVSVSEKFQVVDVSMTVGQAVKKGGVLLSYLDEKGVPHSVLSPVEGIVTKLTPLRKNVVYSGDLPVAEILPEDRKIGARLFLDGGLVGKVHPGADLIFGINGLSAGESQILTGKLTTIPVPEGERYVAQAEFSPESVAYLRSQHFNPIPGYPISAEVIVGRVRLISLLFRDAR